MDQLEEAIAAYQEPLFRFAALRTGSRADAEDIVQDAFLKFALARAPVVQPKAYLFPLRGERLLRPPAAACLPRGDPSADGCLRSGRPAPR